QYADALHRLRSHVDDAIDTHEFVRASETIARLGNRVLMTAQNEADNSEEPAYCDRVNTAANQVRSAIPPMVTQAKQVAISPRDTGAANAWRTANDRLLDSVRAVGDAIAGIQNGRQSAMYQDSLNRASPYPQ
ncbi:hypothetical protein TELCIR_20769, partial [Teladorsagia circumcincta]